MSDNEDDTSTVAVAAAPQKPSLGLWLDDPTSLVAKPEYWDRLKDHGFSTAAIMLESVGDGWNPSYSTDSLAKIANLARPRDIEIVLTIWPEPNPKYLQSVEAGIPNFLKAAGAAALESDVESNWTRKLVNGFPNLDKAGDALVAMYDRLRSSLDVRVELTTFTEHPENSKSADVAPHVDRLYVQAYSVRNRTEGVIDWDGRYGPGGMQRLTLDRANQVPKTNGKPLVCCGLAAYDQEWPGKKGEDAMRVAYDAALHYNPLEIRFWSSKWVLGIKANGYASRFIKSLK